MQLFVIKTYIFIDFFAEQSDIFSDQKTGLQSRVLDRLSDYLDAANRKFRNNFEQLGHRICWKIQFFLKCSNFNWGLICQIKGSQPFGSCISPNQNCSLLRTPKSDLDTLCVPPDQKLYPNKLLLRVFLILRTPCELIMYPKGYAYPRLRTAV